MKKKRKRGVFRGLWLVVALSAGLAGCCGSINCDCDVTSAGDVVVAFDRDSLQSGFRTAEIKGAYIVRYARPDFSAPLDTARSLLASSNGYSSYVSLQLLNWSTRPMTPPAATGKLVDYNYRVLLPSASRTYDISNLEVTTGVGDGCCACPFNKRRRFVLNDN
ncbi:MAG TPA: hypothetical protein VF629_21455 [Hymenobacter sp.]|jgi:hypothetical protein|uniref:hypothetical protein n=1 Tax=Hymenobacter sp. TaxID=1898978 RepID=UPI002EDA8548